MIEIVKYSEKDKKNWDEFIDNAKNGLFMFKRDYMEYHSDRFEDCSLMFFEKDKLVALLPANINGTVLYSHQGLTYGSMILGEKMKQGKMLECFAQLKVFMKEKGLKKLVYKTIPHIFHTYPSEEDLYALFVNNAKLTKIEPSTIIYLPAPYNKSTLRNRCLSKAIKSGVIINKSEDFETFIDVLNGVLQEHHHTNAVHTAEELKLLYSRFPQNIKLYTANYKDKVIAGCLIFEYETTVHTQYLAADDTAREIGGLDLLIKTLIDTYKETKIYFDFGISTENAGKYLNEGLISQKEGFGGRTACYLTWEMNIN